MANATPGGNAAHPGLLPQHLDDLRKSGLNGPTPQALDTNEILWAANLFLVPDAALELRCFYHPPSGKKVTKSVVCRTPEEVVAAAQRHAKAHGIYYTVNPVRSDLAKAAANTDVVRRNWFVLDVDPKRAAGHQDESATDAEKRAAGELADRVCAWLGKRGWPLGVLIDSGNGYHLLYPLDEPNDEVTAALCAAVTHGLDEKFSGEQGTVDKSVHNASRILKLPGTWSQKGANTSERPHRLCRFLYVPSEITPLSRAVLEKTAEALQPTRAKTTEKKPDTPRAKKTPHTGLNSITVTESVDRLQAYANKALENELTRVASASPGNRNNDLNKAAFAIGQFLSWGYWGRESVEERLYNSACQAGLDQDPGCGPQGIRATIRSGLDAGAQEPRPQPTEEPPQPGPEFREIAKNAKGSEDSPAGEGRQQQHQQPGPEFCENAKNAKGSEVPPGDDAPQQQGAATDGAQQQGAAAGGPASPKDNWPDLIPLGKAPPVLAFPLEVLPEKLQTLAQAICWAMNVPADFPGLTMLALAGGAVANARRLLIKKGYFEFTCTYATYVAPPGAAKSAVIKLLRIPFDERQAKLLADWKRELEEWKKTPPQERGPKPVPQRVVCQNTTTETLKILLDQNPRGLMMIRNELSGLVAGMNQYKGGRGDDRQFYLDTWDHTTIYNDRKSEKGLEGAPLCIRHPFTAIFGNIQPDVLPMMRGEGVRGMPPPNDGWLDRFLFCIPNPLPMVGRRGGRST
jgi:hypothetical protein